MKQLISALPHRLQDRLPDRWIEERNIGLDWHPLVATLLHNKYDLSLRSSLSKEPRPRRYRRDEMLWAKAWTLGVSPNPFA
jgi:hypothetical protein